ncbi:MAG: site-2 protease family protein [Oscillospiraceae bacterium]|nr:site-2 protease family protein [Oscillospiraceae bacterium]
MDAIRNVDWTSMLTNALLLIVPALVSLTFHELSHGFVAYKLGDRTAKDEGRLTLNPVRHIDPIGLVMMLIFRFGWAKPVPVNMRNFKNPRRGMAITALAGPISNLILASAVLFIFGLVFTRLGGLNATGANEIIRDIIINTAWLSVMFAVFNMLPIPPLDGSKILFSFIPDNAYYKLMRYERYGFIILIIVVNTQIFRDTIGSATQALFDRLFAIAEATFNLVN